MSTALQKQDPIFPDPHETETSKIVMLETATETMMAYIGYLNTEIHKEEDQPTPNQSKIQALQVQKNVVLDERHAITADSQDLIDKAVYVYAPILKAFYASHG
ncbi:MAG: hypothetical protein WC028_11235 [Candidatus Obscuribacterales bacterium]